MVLPRYIRGVSVVILLLGVGLFASCRPPGLSGGGGEGVLQQARGCGLLQSGDRSGEMDVDNLVRSYVIHVPPHLSRHPHALVLVYEGAEDIGWTAEAYSGMSDLADARGFIAVYPQAYQTGTLPQPSWIPSADFPVDIDFTAHLIRRLTAQLCLDPHRIYAAGFAAGGSMVYGLACALSGTVAAGGTVEATYSREDARGCRPHRYPSLLAIVGTADPEISADAQRQGVLTGAVWLRRWALGAGCRHRRETIWRHHAVTVLAYRACPNHGGMELYTIHGGGHTWPGSPVSWPTYLGPVNHTVNAARVLWQFFAAHPLP